MKKNVYESDKTKEEVSYEDSLRPEIFEHFVGQPDVKESLDLYVQAANQRGDALDHVLFYGSPGLGKTTLAKIISNELGAKFYITSGAVIQKPSDLINSLMKLEDGDVMFIDEIHRLPKVVEEFLYPALEDCAIDIVLDNDNKKETQRVPLAKFTVVGATTRAGMISAPLRDRFGIDYHMEFYEESDLKFIAERTASILDITIDSEAAELIAQGSRGTPRITNRLVKRCRDWAEIKGDGTITLEVVEKTFKMLGIDENGLNVMDRKILKTIIEVYDCKPVGVSSLAASVDEAQETIETVNEPFLIQQGYIERTPRGRLVTNKAKKLFNRGK